jgi:hypothetical protein
LLRWLVSGSPGCVVASTPTPQLEDNGQITLRAEVRNTEYKPSGDAQVRAHVIGPDGSAEDITMRPEPLSQGIYSAQWDAAKSGSYVADIIATRNGTELGRDVLTFRRENGAAENFHTEQNRELLQRLANETGGRYYTPNQARRLSDEISYSEAGITAREMKDLWDMPVVFIVLIGLRAAEWLLRRKWGVI